MSKVETEIEKVNKEINEQDKNIERFENDYECEIRQREALLKEHDYLNEKLMKFSEKSKEKILEQSKEIEENHILIESQREDFFKTKNMIDQEVD